MVEIRQNPFCSCSVARVALNAQLAPAGQARQLWLVAAVRPSKRYRPVAQTSQLAAPAGLDVNGGHTTHDYPTPSLIPNGQPQLDAPPPGTRTLPGAHLHSSREADPREAVVACIGHAMHALANVRWLGSMFGSE